MGISARAILSSNKLTQDYSADLPIPFDGVQFDTGPFWSASNPERLTIPSGVTVVDAHAVIHIGLVTASVTIGLRLRHYNSGGTLLRQSAIWRNETADTFRFQDVSLLHEPVSEGDYFHIQLSSPGDNSITVFSGAGGCYLTVRKVL